MCVVDQKTYIHSDGRRETIETTQRCRFATGSRLCSNPEYRSSEQARIVEMRPASERRPSDGVLVTQGRDGRERLYRDVTRRSSRRTSFRSGLTTSNRSSMDNPSSASSSSYVNVGPPAPTPPPAAPGLTTPERSRVAFEDEGFRTLVPGGTARYENPPPLAMPRALENERRAEPLRRERRSSVSTTAAEVGDDEGVILSMPSTQRRRRPSMIIDTSLRSPHSPPSSSSPGLSQLPKVGELRHDSLYDLPLRHRSNSDRYRSRPGTGESSRQGQAEGERRRQEQEEDVRQARLERERLAESDRRQEARRNAETAAREASRERHQRDAAAKLEARRDAAQQERIDAEYEQMARERAAAASRQRLSEQTRQSADDQLRRDADARARDQAYRTSPHTSRRLTGDGVSYNSSPLSLRSPLYPPPLVTVHQYPSARRGDPIRDQGEQVIAWAQERAEREDRTSRAYPTERTRRASQQLEDVMAGLAIDVDDDSPSEEANGGAVEEYYVSEGLQRRGSERRRRDPDREERRRRRVFRR